MPCWFNYCGDHCAGVCFPGRGNKRLADPGIIFRPYDGSDFWKELKVVSKRSDTQFVVEYKNCLYVGNSVKGYVKERYQPR